jgi:hypothetical protein
MYAHLFVAGNPHHFVTNGYVTSGMFRFQCINRDQFESAIGLLL